jgi:hypothetical protein
LPNKRLLGEVVAAFLDGEHGALLPVLGLAPFGVGLVAEALLIGDGGGHLLLGLRQLRAHVDENLVQHLLRILGGGDEIVDVRTQ